MQNFLLSGKRVPRWVILLIDLGITTASFSLSYFVVKQFEFAEILRRHFFWYTGLYWLISLLVFYFMRIHTGLIRYSNIHDMFRIFASLFISSLIYPLAVALILTYAYNIHSLDVSRVLFVNFFIASSSHIMLLTGVKGIYYQAKHQTTGDQKKVLIYASDNKAVLIKHEKIKIAKIRNSSHSQILADIQELLTICEQDDHSLLGQRMKEIVREYKSKNSMYDSLDLING